MGRGRAVRKERGRAVREGEGKGCQGGEGKGCKGGGGKRAERYEWAVCDCCNFMNNLKG